MKRFLLLLGLVILAACSQPQSGNGSTGNKVDVTVSVAFPSPQSQHTLDPLGFLRTLGAPRDAYGATITITPTAGGSPITATVNRDSPSTTVALNTGDYNFEASVYTRNDNSLEIAWGETGTVSISADTTINIQVQSIIRSALLWASGAPIQQYDKAEVELLVSSGPSGFDPYGGLQVPPGDYSVSWSVSDTTDSITGNALGAEVTWGGQSNTITVTATVSGMGENHQPTTLTATANIYHFQAAGSGFTLTGTLPNWNGPADTKIVPLAGFSGPADTPVADPASVDASGDFSLNYFDGNDMSNARKVLIQFENSINNICVANETWSSPPGPVVLAMQESFELWDMNGDTIGEARIVDTNNQSILLGFWYADRNASIVGSCEGPTGFAYTFNLQLQAGWNAIREVYSDSGTPQDFSDDSLELTGGAFNNNPYSIPSDYFWDYYLYNPPITDYGLSAPQTSFNPAEGSTVDVTLSVYNYSTVNRGPVTVTLSADNGLSVTNITGADSVAPDYSSFNLNVASGAARDVTLTVSVASGTVGQTLTLTAELGPDDDPTNNVVAFTFTPAASGQSVNVGIAMDLNPPMVYFDAPLYNGIIDSTSSSYTVDVRAGDTESGVAEIKLYQGYQLLAKLSDGGVTQDPNNTSRYLYSWNVGSLAAGKYQLTAIAYDEATNASVTSVVVTVQ